MSAEPDSWKTSLPCTRAEAEAIDAAGDIAIDAVLMTTEEIEDDIERWRLDAYTEREPDSAMLAALRALVPSAADVPPVIEPLTAADWVAMSQEGLEPIREGRFVVHTSAHPIESDAGSRAFLIDAGGVGRSSPADKASSGMPGPIPAMDSLIGLPLGPTLIFSLSATKASLIAAVQRS